MTDRSHKVRCVCAKCGTHYRKRVDRVCQNDYCSLACRKAGTAAKLAARARPCEKCSRSFVPRLTQLAAGQGRFCSNKCSLDANGHLIHTPESRARSVATFRRNGHDKRLSERRGPLHPQWTGGATAARHRQIESGKSKERVRRYRQNNPHRVREWAKRRKNGKVVARLPYGTIPRLYGHQGGKCVYCKVALPSNYHVDHIMPLHLGGQHKPDNLQLLCPTCNVRKWALHPDEFARRRGITV